MIDDQNQLSNTLVDISLQLNLIRRRFLESVSVVLLVLAIIGMPLSLSRLFQISMNLNHISHLCISIVIFVVFLCRRKLTDRWLVSLLLLIFTVLSLTAFLQYGIVSAGFFFAAACIFIAGTALGLWGGIICAVFYFSAISIIAYLWMSGHLTFPVDVREYILMPTVWALLCVSFIITNAVFFVSATGFFTSLKKLVNTINSQKQEIEKQATELTRANQELEAALYEVKTLSGLLPICSRCKKIRDDKGYWNQIEHYIASHTDASFSHGECPECTEKIYGDQTWYKEWKKKA